MASWDKEGRIDMLDEGLVRENQLKRRRADTVDIDVADTIESGAEGGDTDGLHG
jgi:hypothetical protein